MKKSIFTLLIMMLFGSVYAQQTQYPSYYQTLFDYHLYENNATCTGILYIDDVIADEMYYEVGVFDETTEVYVGGIPAASLEGHEHPLYYLTYYGNTNDVLTFRLYNHVLGEEMDYVCDLSMPYIPDQVSGSVSNPFQFRFYSEGHDYVFNNVEDNDWSNVANWTVNDEPATRLPMSLDNAIIYGVCEVTEAPVVASLVIKDGAQFFAPEGLEIVATVEKDITAYTGDYNNWYFISSPVQEFSDFEGAGMLTEESEYDLYFFDQTYPGEPEEDEDNGEWRNYKYYLENDDVESFEAPFGGYLYGNSQNVTLSFNGLLFTDASIDFKKLTFDNASDDHAKGFNLVGNPYASNALAVHGNKVSGFYMMNVEGGRQDVIAADDEVLVAPATAILAVATAKNNNAASVTFTPQDGEAIVRGNARVNVELFANGILQDRAYVKMGEGDNMIKFSLRNTGAKVYVPQNNKNYAIAYAGENNVMPVSFTTTENGTYTLSINAENMTCDYLHLIDNMTGADVDLLSTSTYTFEANTSDYTSRFKLVFAEEAINEIAASFAYISNGNLIINNDGAAKLQMMDAAGRILSVENINGSYSKSLNLSAGVYIVRLINGVDVKTQKIVVE